MAYTKLSPNHLRKAPQRIINNLTTLYNKGKIEETLGKAQDAINEFPNTPAIHNMLGVIYSIQGQKNLSVNHFQEVLKLEPNNYHAYNNLCVALIDFEDFEEAQKLLETALKINPNYPNSYYNMGIIKQHKGMLDEAIEVFEQAIILKPNYTAAYNSIGNCLKDKGALEEAIKAYSKVVSFNPNYADSHYNIGNVLQEQGKKEEAVEAYTKAISINPNFADSYYNMGNILQEQNKKKEAVEAYTKAISINPNSADIFYNMGNALEDLGKLEKAIEVYKKAVMIQPDYIGAYNNMGNIFVKLDCIEDAIISYKKALEINPDNETIEYVLFALTGRKKNTAPQSYIKNLFDGYASNFESALIKKLDYTAPAHIANAIINYLPNQRFGAMMDLGCGTGLVGKELSKYYKKIEGVDLSKDMLIQAEKKKIYNKLYHQEIVDFLKKNDLDFDVIISADVFIYVGDLAEIFYLIKAKNKRSGYLVFSTEHTEKGENFFLERSARYSHSKEYIEKLCKQFDYKLFHFEKINLRKENGKFLIGGIYILQFYI